MYIARERRLGHMKSAARKSAAQLILTRYRRVVEDFADCGVPLLFHRSVRFVTLRVEYEVFPLTICGASFAALAIDLLLN